VFMADCAFLQQSGMFAIGQELSFACALTPNEAPMIARISMKLVNRVRMSVENIVSSLIECQRTGER
jgi:hypothetical protein